MENNVMQELIEFVGLEVNDAMDKFTMDGHISKVAYDAKEYKNAVIFYIPSEKLDKHFTNDIFVERHVKNFNVPKEILNDDDTWNYLTDIHSLTVESEQDFRYVSISTLKIPKDNGTKQDFWVIQLNFD